MGDDGPQMQHAEQKLAALLEYAALAVNELANFEKNESEQALNDLCSKYFDELVALQRLLQEQITTTCEPTPTARNNYVSRMAFESSMEKVELVHRQLSSMCENELH